MFKRELPDLNKGFLNPIQKCSISDLSLGKTLTVHHDGPSSEEVPIIMVLRVILKGMVKVYFRLMSLINNQSELMRSLEKF